MGPPIPGPLTPRLSVFMIRALEEKKKNDLKIAFNGLISCQCYYFLLLMITSSDDRTVVTEFTCMKWQRSTNESSRILYVAFNLHMYIYMYAFLLSQLTLLFMLIIIIITIVASQFTMFFFFFFFLFLSFFFYNFELIRVLLTTDQAF